MQKKRIKILNFFPSRMAYDLCCCCMMPRFLPFLSFIKSIINLIQGTIYYYYSVWQERKLVRIEYNRDYCQDFMIKQYVCRLFEFILLVSYINDSNRNIIIWKCNGKWYNEWIFLIFRMIHHLFVLWKPTAKRGHYKLETEPGFSLW